MSENPKTILIVEDIEFYRRTVSVVLSKKGINTIEADDGDKAVEMFKQQPVDAVLMDAMLPTVDGFDATRQIRQLASGADVPIIFMTALYQDGDIEEAYAVGATDYVTKPLDMELLLDKLQKLGLF